MHVQYVKLVHMKKLLICCNVQLSLCVSILCLLINVDFCHESFSDIHVAIVAWCSLEQFKSQSGVKFAVLLPANVIFNCGHVSPSPAHLIVQ